jgi:hypothetical protein
MSEQQTIFQQKRANVPDDEKSGQFALLDFLEHLLPTVDEIVLKTPLRGQLDFSILSECKFDNIRAIVLEPGEITGIVNLPKTIRTLHVPGNLLQDLVDLPESLVELHAPSNGFTSLDLSALSELKRAHLSNNELQDIRLPASLETLVCENNRLRELDLAGLDALRHLHCSGNPLLSIRHAQDHLEIDMENNPMVEIQKDRERNSKQKKGDHDQNQNKNKDIDVQDALAKYMAKKNEYETKVKSMLETSAESMQKMKRAERRANLREIRMHAPCIKCARPVGTIFTNKKRVFKAVCGDPKHPCELSVEIHAGQYQDLLLGLSIISEECREVQQKMIEMKMDSVFNYNKDERQLAAAFNDYKEQYTLDMEIYKSAQQDYAELYVSEERQRKIDALNAKIFGIQTNIDQILLEMKKMDTSNAVSKKPEAMRDAMRAYIDELIPARLELQHTVYEWMELEKGVLIERHSRLSKRDYVLNDAEIINNTW